MIVGQSHLENEIIRARQIHVKDQTIARALLQRLVLTSVNQKFKLDATKKSKLQSVTHEHKRVTPKKESVQNTSIEPNNNSDDPTRIVAINNDIDDKQQRVTRQNHEEKLTDCPKNDGCLVNGKQQRIRIASNKSVAWNYQKRNTIGIAICMYLLFVNECVPFKILTDTKTIKDGENSEVTAGGFDDLILFYLNRDRKRNAIYVQFKHKERKGKDPHTILKNNLISLSDDLSLIKLFASGYPEEGHLVLFTNSQLDSELANECEWKNPNFDIGFEHFLKHVNAVAYRFPFEVFGKEKLEKVLKKLQEVNYKGKPNEKKINLETFKQFLNQVTLVCTNGNECNINELLSDFEEDDIVFDYFSTDIFDVIIDEWMLKDVYKPMEQTAIGSIIYFLKLRERSTKLTSNFDYKGTSSCHDCQCEYIKDQLDKTTKFPILICLPETCNAPKVYKCLLKHKASKKNYTNNVIFIEEQYFETNKQKIMNCLCNLPIAKTVIFIVNNTAPNSSIEFASIEANLARFEKNDETKIQKSTNKTNDQKNNIRVLIMCKPINLALNTRIH